MTDRRTFLALATIGLASVMGCSSSGHRCATCGMKIDPASRFTSWLVVAGREIAFDTPQCALHGWRGPYESAEEARFHEYYSQEIRSATKLAFVSGSDVNGPMGPEIVAIDPDQAPRFLNEHGGGAPMSAEALRERRAR